jgi:hypothetical protein
VPLFHPNRQIKLEIHAALFPVDSPLNRGDLFRPANILSQSVASTFRGRAVLRLSDELQLIYIASYWMRDLSMLRINPTFLPPLVDMVRILSARRHRLDWNHLLRLLDNERAAASLYLVLSYLCRRDLAGLSPELLTGIETRQESLGSGELWTIHALVDRYLVGGRPFFTLFSSDHIWRLMMEPSPYLVKLFSLPWYIVFPPGPADRFTVRRQMYRIARRFRGTQQ